MILRKYTSSDYPQVMQLKVHPDQEKFVGTIDELFDLKTPYWNFNVIEVEKQIVGFFKIDTNYSNQYNFTLPNELGFRAFFIDLAHQGQGYCFQSIQLLKPLPPTTLPSTFLRSSHRQLQKQSRLPLLPQRWFHRHPNTLSRWQSWPPTHHAHLPHKLTDFSTPSTLNLCLQT